MRRDPAVAPESASSQAESVWQRMRRAASRAARQPGFALAGLLGLAYLGVSTLLRLVLWLRFGTVAGVGAGSLPAILAAGVVHDAVAAIFLLLPLTLYLALRPRRWAGWRLQRVALAGLIAGGTFAVLYTSAVEFYFFEEFDARFNLVAVDYLMYPHEVLVNIWDSYPVMPVVLATAAVSLLFTAGLWSVVRRQPATPWTWRRRLGALALQGAVVAAAVALPTHALDRFDNRVAGELARNGTGSFFEALRTQEIDYYAYYHTGDPQTLFGVLTRHLAAQGGRFTRVAEGRLNRRVDPASGPRLANLAIPGPRLARRPPAGGVVAAVDRGAQPPVFSTAADRPRPLNVVVIVEESFGAEFLGAYGDDRGLSPEFDALAERGLLFTQAYATGTRTVRGLEAIVTSFPPIPSVSILRRPGNEGIATWGSEMVERGYRTSFLYGGYAPFDNMSYFFSHNGFAVSDRTDIPAPAFSNIWGVSDEDLFLHAIRYFDQIERRAQPFFSVVLTTSNHKPFTFPPGVPGVPESGGHREAGVRYADYALGAFFRQAAGHPWFDDTLFVVVADHGARVYGAAEVPLYSYEIPILLLAPGRLEPRRVDLPVSQIDIAPTVLGLLGEPYEAPFFGQDVLAGDASEDRALLFNHNHSVALLRGEEMVIFGLRGAVAGSFYERGERRFTPITPDPELVQLATAYYQTAYDQFTRRLYR